MIALHLATAFATLGAGLIVIRLAVDESGWFAVGTTIAGLL